MRTRQPPWTQTRSVALEWLTYEESRLPHEDLEEQIKHARNGGEKAVKTSFQKYLAPTYQLKVTLESKRRIKCFLVITPNGFEHVYQTGVFPVHEFVAGSTRLDQLMHKLAGKLNSNEEFHCVLQRSEQQFDLIKQKYDKLTNPYKARVEHASINRG